MNKQELQELKAKCETATQGVWRVDFKEPDWYGIESDSDKGGWICVSEEKEYPHHHPVLISKKNAEYIAAANPTAILRLIESYESALGVIEFYSTGSWEGIKTPKFVMDKGDLARDFLRSVGEE